MAAMKRITLAAGLLATTAALAASPRKPAAAIGSAKEDEPVVVTPATPGPDVALLRGLAWAFEPAPLEVRAQAVEDLGFLQDPRALNPLAVLTLDANPTLARAAVRAVGAIRHPRAEEILSNLVRHPNASIAVKQQALGLIPFQNTPTALRFVHFTARQQSGSYEVFKAAQALSAQLPVPDPDSIFAAEPTPAPPPTPAPLAGDEK